MLQNRRQRLFGNRSPLESAFNKVDHPRTHITADSQILIAWTSKLVDYILTIRYQVG